MAETYVADSEPKGRSISSKCEAESKLKAAQGADACSRVCTSRIKLVKSLPDITKAADVGLRVRQNSSRGARQRIPLNKSGPSKRNSCFAISLEYARFACSDYFRALTIMPLGPKIKPFQLSVRHRASLKQRRRPMYAAVFFPIKKLLVYLRLQPTFSLQTKMHKFLI